MSVGCWGNTCCQLKWLVGGAWRKQRKSMRLKLKLAVGCAADTGA